MCLQVHAMVFDHVVNDIDCIIGMDVIKRLGGVFVDGEHVPFGDTRLAANFAVVKNSTCL